MATTRSLVGEHRALLRDPEFALNADGGVGVLDEATGEAAVYYVQGAEKLYATYELTVRNPGGHSSEPRLDNAIYKLADALKAVQAYRFPVMWNDWTIGSFRAAADVTPGSLGDAMKRFAADPRDEAAANVLYENPSYVGLTRTTCIPTRLTARARGQRAAAVGDCDGELPDLPRRRFRARPRGSGVSGGRGRRSAAHRRGCAERRLADAQGRDGGGCDRGACELSRHADRPADGGLCDRRLCVPRPRHRDLRRQWHLPQGQRELLARAERARAGQSFYRGLTHWYVLIKELAGR